MQSLFPALLDFSLVATFLLRITTGLFFVLFGYRLLHATRQIKGQQPLIRTVGLMYGLTKLTIGILLTIGLYTQGAALAGALMSLLGVFQGGASEKNTSSQQVQILLFVLCLSLVFYGAGIFAYDLPL